MNEVGAILLGTSGGDFPEPGLEIEFRPFGVGDFALATSILDLGRVISCRTLQHQ